MWELAAGFFVDLPRLNRVAGFFGEKGGVKVMKKYIFVTPARLTCKPNSDSPLPDFIGND
jgi:hypothetical protein